VNVSDVDGSMDFIGFVHAAGLNQTISGTVYNPVNIGPRQHGYDMILDGNDTIFKPGSEVTISYGFYHDQMPINAKQILYYVTATGTDFDTPLYESNHQWGAREVIIAGKTTTDPQGKFTIIFDAPETQCAIHVTLEVPIDPAGSNATIDTDNGQYYDVWPQNGWDREGFVFYVYEGRLDGDKEVSISGGSFKPGMNGTVNIELSAGKDDPVMVMWGIGEGTLETADISNPEWTSWVPAGNILRLVQTESGKYEGTFMVPEFIEDQDVTIISGYMDSETGVPHFDSKTISPGSSFPWLWIIIVIIIIVVVIVVIVVVKQRF
jgi:hypothetical protein